jgi:hypothetical protein
MLEPSGFGGLSLGDQNGPVSQSINPSAREFSPQSLSSRSPGLDESHLHSRDDSAMNIYTDGPNETNQHDGLIWHQNYQENHSGVYGDRNVNFSNQEATYSQSVSNLCR